jgi:hypothetical protein
MKCSAALADRKPILIALRPEIRANFRVNAVNGRNIEFGENDTRVARVAVLPFVELTRSATTRRMRTIDIRVLPNRQ